MTEIEALKFINERIEFIKANYNDDIADYREALELSAMALNKQIPKKPIFDFNSSDTSSKFHCTCGTSINVYHEIGTMDNNDAPNYCYYCGNKIDWSDKD